MDSDAAQVLTGMAYESTYELHDHYAPENMNPLDTVAMHAGETYKELSGLYRAMERYERYGVYTNFGLSLIDYLSLPRDVVDIITDLTIAIGERQEAIENTAEAGARHDVRSGNAWRHIR